MVRAGHPCWAPVLGARAGRQSPAAAGWLCRGMVPDSRVDAAAPLASDNLRLRLDRNTSGCSSSARSAASAARQKASILETLSRKPRSRYEYMMDRLQTLRKGEQQLKTFASTRSHPLPPLLARASFPVAQPTCAIPAGRVRGALSAVKPLDDATPLGLLVLVLEVLRGQHRVGPVADVETHVAGPLRAGLVAAHIQGAAPPLLRLVRSSEAVEPR